MLRAKSRNLHQDVGRVVALGYLGAMTADGDDEISTGGHVGEGSVGHGKYE